MPILEKEESVVDRARDALEVLQIEVRIGEVYSVMADAVINRNLTETREDMSIIKEQNVTDKIMVSCNGKELGWEMIENGEMAATSPNPPSLNADLCVQQIVKYLTGEDFLQYLQIMPWDVLTKDNLDKAIPWITADYMAGREANDFEWELSFYEDSYINNADVFVDFDAKLVEYLESH